MALDTFRRIVRKPVFPLAAAGAGLILLGVSETDPQLPDIVLLAGIVLACLSALALYFAWKESRRSKRAESVNREFQRELTACKLTQEVLASARDELERRVEARMTELARANEDLRAEIAERTRFEETLQASEQRYRELFDNASDLVYLHDLKGKFLAINKAAQCITGYTREEALALNISNLVAPEHVELVRGMIARLLAGEPASTYEVSAVTKSGTRLFLELSTHLVFRSGAPVAVQGIARDVTERKRLEEQLRHSQRMEAIGRLAGGLAHDFNNLLTVVGAYSQMICDESKGATQVQAYAEEILAAAQRAAALTGRLLAFSRRQMLQPQVLNLNQLILGMDNMLRRLLGEDVELRTVFDSELGTIKADPGQIEQVIMNLAVNARDAMPRGGRLTIETANVELSQAGPGGTPAGSYVKLAVTDTGVGMSPETRDHIFEPFFTTKAPGKGTGLGLATVYGIVKQTGGEITVESEPGNGTTFNICFQRSTESCPPAASPEPTCDAALRARQRVTILLVEDEPVVRRLVRTMLVERGYRVIEAACGEEGLALFEQQHAPVDLVITDIVMPNMTGNEMARRLLVRRPGLRILYMTGYSEESIFELGVPAETTPVLKKPFLADALDRKVREALATHPDGER